MTASEVCKDAHDVLKGAVEIHYDNTEVWRLEEGETEHPLVPALRAAAMDALVSEPGPDLGLGIDDLRDNLKNERMANEKMRDFLVRLQSMCELGGFSGGGPDELLAWLREKL